MRVVMISCWDYRDAWGPFFKLFDEFCDCPRDDYWFLTDLPRDEDDDNYEALEVVPDDWQRKFYHNGESWCEKLAAFAVRSKDPILLFQEDFWLTRYFRDDLVEYAETQMLLRDAGMVRLNPCPGANEDYLDRFVGIVKPGTDYRISCQLSLWRPDYLAKIAKRCTTPWDFEIKGSRISSADYPDEVLAWKREATPYPVDYLTTAIVNGKWTRGARQLCEEHGISADFSKREFIFVG